MLDRQRRVILYCWLAAALIMIGGARGSARVSTASSAQPVASQAMGGGAARVVPPKPQQTIISPGGYEGSVVVKLREGLQVRQLAGRLVDEQSGELTAINRVLTQSVVAGFGRMFSRRPTDLTAERLAAQLAGGRQLADLNLYYQVAVTDPAAAEEIINQLNQLDDIEIAYYQPRPEPAQAASPDVTPSFETDQDYLKPAPGGVDAVYAWTQPGGKGQGIKIVDIEGGWRTTHEDLTKSVGGLLGGVPINDLSWRNHGTAVIGEMIADSNLYGVTGIAHEAEIGMVSIGGLSTPEALSLATASLEPGDVILIELHAPGPRHNFESRDDQLGYVCMEYWPATFDAIQIASAKGIIVCEAAGNGAEDLDHPIYENRFDTTYRNSHAILCGAGAPPSGFYGADRSRLGFSNYSERVNLQGYGRGVVTTGYGGLYSAGGEDFYYTATFSGTSSASPIVTAAVACLSGHYQATYGVSLTPDQARDFLVATGSAQTPDGNEHIGPRPDLQAAFSAMVAPPPVSVQPVYLDTALTQGEQLLLTLTITNDLSGPDWQFTATVFDTMLYRTPEVDWFSVSPTAGSVPGSGGTIELTVTIDGSKLDPADGLIKGSVLIEATGGSPAYQLLIPVFVTSLCTDDQTYAVTDSDSPGGPLYTWVDAVTLGTVIPQGDYYNANSPGAALDDGTVGPLALGFNFDFYGTLYNEVYVGINGALSFTASEINSNGYFSDVSIPGSFLPEAIFAFWNDLVIDPSFGHGDLYLYRSATNDTFVVEWYRVGNFNDDADTLTTFEILLTADGLIRVQLADVGTSGLEQTATIGLEQADCRYELYVDGSQPAENLPHNSLVVEFGGSIPCDCSGFGDLDGNAVIDPVDVVYLVNHVYQGLGTPPIIPNCIGNNGDWDCDGMVNPVDVVWMVGFVYRSSGLGPCDPCQCVTYPVDCP